MKISAASSYALQSLMRLAHCDQEAPISSNRLARNDIPRRFLAQVLHKLVEHKLLTSTAGVAGGYSLARPPQAITLLEVIEAAEGTFSIAMAPMPDLPKEAENYLSTKLADTSECVRERLRTITLANLICEQSNAHKRTGDAAENGDRKAHSS